MPTPQPIPEAFHELLARPVLMSLATTLADGTTLLHHPDWSLTHLRTTSRLERFNRRLRRRARAASAYHSDAGLAAMIAQEVEAFHAPHP